MEDLTAVTPFINEKDLVRIAQLWHDSSKEMDPMLWDTEADFKFSHIEVEIISFAIYRAINAI